MRTLECQGHSVVTTNIIKSSHEDFGRLGPTGQICLKHLFSQGGGSISQFEYQIQRKTMGLLVGDIDLNLIVDIHDMFHKVTSKHLGAL